MKRGTFEKRLARHLDELRWLYMELYDNGSMFAELCETMRWYAENRRPVLRRRDDAREQDPGWYKRRDLLRMMLYWAILAGTRHGVRDHVAGRGPERVHGRPDAPAPGKGSTRAGTSSLPTRPSPPPTKRRCRRCSPPPHRAISHGCRTAGTGS